MGKSEMSFSFDWDPYWTPTQYFNVSEVLNVSHLPQRQRYFKVGGKLKVYSSWINKHIRHVFYLQFTIRFSDILLNFSE